MPDGTVAKDEGQVDTVASQNANQQAGTGVTVTKATAIMLVLALGAHSLFEGIALGLQDSTESAGKLAAGILIHKWAAAVSLGGAFARTGYTTKEIIVFLILFALATPLGVFIGMGINGINSLVDVVFIGLSGGTFLYVSCTEIIATEFQKGNKQWIKTLLVFLGALLITVLWFFDAHEHAHGCDGDDHEGHDDHSGHGH